MSGSLCWLLQTVIWFVTLNQHLNINLTLSQHLNINLTLNQHLSINVTLNQHPNINVTLNKHLNINVTLNQHLSINVPLNQHPNINVALNQHLNIERLTPLFVSRLTPLFVSRYVMPAAGGIQKAELYLESPVKRAPVIQGNPLEQYLLPVSPVVKVWSYVALWRNPQLSAWVYIDVFKILTRVD